MKFWQMSLINACVTALVVFAVMKLILPHAASDQSEELRKALNKQIDGIQLKLSGIEDAISQQKKQASLTALSAEPLDNSKAISNLNQKLDMVLGKLAILENKDWSAQGPDPLTRSFGSSMIQRQGSPAFSMLGRGLSNWIEELSEDKQQEVKNILEENALRLRDKLPPPEPGGRLPDRRIIVEVMKENDLLLKQELKAVLSEEEYQRFLDSHPAP